MCVDYWLMANGKKGELTEIYNFESPKFTLMIAFPQLMIQMIEIGCAKRDRESFVYLLFDIHREGGRGRRRARERKRNVKKRN